jgi:uncharacterized membrane protein YgcG
VEAAARRVETEAPHRCGGSLVPGFQFAIVLSDVDMPALPGHAPPATIERAAVAAHDTLGVGRASCNDGLVLALSRGDRKLHWSSGAGTKRYLSDGALAAVTQRMKKPLRELTLAAALEGAAADVLAALQAGSAAAGEAPLPSGHDAARAAAVAALVNEYWWDNFWAWVWFLSLVVVLVACLGYGAWWYDQKKKAELREAERLATLLQRMQGARAAAGAAAAAPGAPPLAARITTCPICLDDFEAGAVTSVLPCQHKFHTNCVTNWATAGSGANNRQCPVCRAPMDGAPRPPPPAAGGGGGGGARASPSCGGAGQGAGGGGGGLFGVRDDRMDLLFLLDRLAWRFPGRAHELHRYRADPLGTDFVRQHQAALVAERAEAARVAEAGRVAAANARADRGYRASYGGGLHSRSFGGGSSRGGGGAGGGW